MTRRNLPLALLCLFFASLAIQPNAIGQSADAGRASAAINPVIEWNRTLLVILRTPGAQPATLHSTRSLAMLHAAIFDAVNAIDQSYHPYAVRLSHVSRWRRDETYPAGVERKIVEPSRSSSAWNTVPSSPCCRASS